MRTDVKIGVVLGLLVVAGIVIYFSVTNGDGPSTESGGPDAAAPGKKPSLDNPGAGEPSPKPPVDPDSGPLSVVPPAPRAPSPATPSTPLPTIAPPPRPSLSDPLEPGGPTVTPEPAGPASPPLPAVPPPSVPDGSTPPGVATPGTPAPGVLPDPGLGDTPGPMATVRPPDADPTTPAVDPDRVAPVGPIVPVAPEPAPLAEGGQVTEYVVKSGDGLWKIAEAVYNGKGWLWPRIAKANPDVDAKALRVGQKLKIPPPPAPTPAAVEPVVGAVPPGGGKYYVVVAGDKGFWQIAEKNYGKGTLWPRIAKANPGVNPNKLKIGQKIVIPPLEAAVVPGVVTPGVAGGGGAVAVDPVALPPGTRAYTVKSGDTLEAIAAAMYGAGKHWPVIEKANPGINPNALRVGKTLAIPPLPARAGSSEPAGRPAVAPRPRGDEEDMPRTARRPRPYFE